MTSRSFLRCCLSAAFWPVSLFAASPVPYEIRPPSVVWSECNLCLGWSRLSTLGGSFVLTEEEAGPEQTVYRLTEVKFQIPGEAEYTGSGTYRLRHVDPETRMDLDLARDGAPAISFSGWGYSAGPGRWPVIEVQVRNVKPQFFGETFYITAAPMADYLEYQLAPGAELVVDCRDCGLPPAAYPLAGSFRAGLIAEDGESSLYRLEAMKLRPLEVDERFLGYGLLSIARGTLKQKADISLSGRRSSFYLSSDDGQAGAALPAIDVTSRMRDRQAPERILATLRLVASPATAAPFLRGDPNGDGAVDLSDGAAVIAWVVLGGAAPLCREAADVNLDRRHDPADAIALLQYLFLGGAPPPFPGARWCGLPQELTFGCEGYEGCPSESPGW